MTTPATIGEVETPWVTDAELIRRLGVPEKIARAALRVLDSQRSGFPQKQKLWGDRRYYPAVIAYFNEHHGIIGNDAARLAAESRDRTRSPRHQPHAAPSGGASR